MKNVLTYTLEDIKNSPYTNLSLFSYTSILHRHDFFEFAIISEGHCISKINDNPERKLSRGEMIFTRPCDTHTITPADRIYKHRDLYVTEEKMREICSGYGKNFYERITSPDFPLEYKIGINEFYSIEQKALVLKQSHLDAKKSNRSLTFAEQLHTSLINQLIGIMLYHALPETDEQIPLWLEKLNLQIEQFDLVTYSVKKVITTTGYSHGYVCRTFKRVFGETLINRLNRSKVLYSVNLLGKMKIVDIAMLLGWENPKNYAIAFKKVYGESPSQYLKRNPPKVVEKNREILLYRGLK